ncbi:MAG: ATP-binding cassette domain-containing protein [Deltaproteobacteria bacterium]|nr:ATP-binding cassette domain-containing protein [Deltaproteobacteria bacterium]MBW2016457.1 ATP-binding cassette domain-containing protein [Deltaproteobacteria bacterium]MBW2130388.1 ATP-binding cassette domain-containing protein [Deltaproteobacteria bacterium]MBW2304486.1 ATP-binding cassette domain-containing protein [Deltaproteobacteria bacterium]
MIKLQGIRKTFKKGTIDEKLAIDGITLHIHPGDFVTIIGSNGAGKTTLLNLIAGTIFPDEGEIIIDGTPVTHLPEHRRAKYLGRIFQDPLLGTASSMTIEENLAMADLRGQPRGLKWGVAKSRKEYYREILKMLELGLETRLKDPVSLLSGGQRQSLTLLMATLSLPKLLLLDEHTAALDPRTGAKVIELTDKIVRENKLTTIMVTHNMNQAIRYGNRMIMLHEGKVRFDVGGEQKAALTVEEVVKKFGSDLKDETLLC